MIDKDYLKDLVEILNENSLTEISIKNGDKEIVIKKEIMATSVVPSVLPSTITSTDASFNIAPTERKGKPITSPMVGTFYKSSSPDSESFVQIGSSIAEGQVVCIIEAMKLMNEIESDTAGKVVEICVEDGQPVEFGQVLMYVE